MKKLTLILILWPVWTVAQPTGIRAACKMFIESGLVGHAGADFGVFSEWTVIDNRDSTFSVGAKYVLRSGRPVYTTCIIKPQGTNFVLVKLSRLL
jgi:hypothetical protein